MRNFCVSLSVALAVAGAIFSTAARAQPGKLDASFGHNGRVAVALPEKELELPYPQKPKAAPMAMYLLPGGGLAAANNRYLVERRQDGGPAQNFGRGGKVPLVSPVGWKFELADLAVDGEGRGLVAGTLASLTTGATPDPSRYNEGRESHGPRPRLGIVLRYLPDGSLDPSFNKSGVVYGEFGQMPPTGPGPYDYEYAEPAVGLTGLDLAAGGGIVLAGYSAEHVTGGCAPPATGATGRSFIVRLRDDRSLYSNFGSACVLSFGRFVR